MILKLTKLVLRDLIYYLEYEASPTERILADFHIENFWKTVRNK